MSEKFSGDAAGCRSYFGSIDPIGDVVARPRSNGLGER
jgi:hypothetical protein